MPYPQEHRAISLRDILQWSSARARNAPGHTPLSFEVFTLKPLPH